MYCHLRVKLSILTVLFLLPLMIFSAYGHGLFGETLPPVSIQNRNVTFSINSVLSPGPPAKADKVITIQIYETNTKKPIKDVTFYVRASKDSKVLFEREFLRDNGNLVMSISTTDSGDVSIWEQERVLARMFGPLLGGSTDAALIKGPIFDSGGLYKFHVEILTADTYQYRLYIPVKYDAAISIPDTTSYQIDDKNYGKQTVKIITYYDQISNFQYLPETKSIKFWMPFDWSADNINQVSVVHEEIQIPRSFGDLLVTKYAADVNNLPLPNSAITVDDYSTDDRIVHIVLYKPELQEFSKINENTKQGMEFILKPNTESGFPLRVLSRNAQYKVNLSWDPPTLVSGSKTKFSFDFRDAYLITNKTIPVSYEFYVLQNDHVILNHNGTTAQSGLPGDTIDALIPNDVSGPIRIKFENLGGNRYGDAEFLSVINKPAISSPKFPLKLPSFLEQGGSKVPGKYEVELTWFPSIIPIDQQVEFVFTIKDKQTGRPIPVSGYNFVILQKRVEIYRMSGVTGGGGDYVDYTFSNGQDGPSVLRIESINNSTESVEIPFVVAPEFPIGLLPILSVAFIVMLIFVRLKTIVKL